MVQIRPQALQLSLVTFFVINKYHGYKTKLCQQLSRLFCHLDTLLPRSHILETLEPIARLKYNVAGQWIDCSRRRSHSCCLELECEHSSPVGSKPYGNKMWELRWFVTARSMSVRESEVY